MPSSPEALTAELLSRTREMPVTDIDKLLSVTTPRPWSWAS